MKIARLILSIWLVLERIDTAWWWDAKVIFGSWKIFVAHSLNGATSVHRGGYGNMGGWDKTGTKLHRIAGRVLRLGESRANVRGGGR